MGSRSQRTKSPVRGSVVLAILCLMPALVFAQQATTNHNANLRRDPTTASPVMSVLENGSRLMLVDSTEDSGFYHVRTEDDQVGWVYDKLVTVSKAPTTVSAELAAAPAGGGGCDATLWSHVYNSTRLNVKTACVTVTGKIVDATAGKQKDGVRHEPDGDTHGWLEVDPQFKDMLNAGNLSAEGGNLVFEIVCRFPVSQADARKACKGYTDQVQLPAVGSRVSIVGTYVQDTFHAKWNEIHPVTRISVVP